MIMKQMEVTEKKVGENTYYIKPFPAFVAANISGELAAIITPMLGGLSSILGGNADEISDDVALSTLGNAFSGLTGDKVEKLLKKLLVDHKNISVEAEATDWNVKPLTYDLCNEIFCGDVADMYVLCIEVIKLNFGGFFKKLGIQFGSLTTDIQKKIPNTENGEN